MEHKDYYRTLGVERSASPDQIKRAYRKLARKHHPDVNPGDRAAEERFKEINEAFQVLSDPEKRSGYDQAGAEWQQYAQSSVRPERTWSAQADGATAYTHTISPEELGQMFGGGRAGPDFLQSLFGARPGASDFGSQDYFQPGPERGRDVDHAIEVTLEEAFHGTNRTVQGEDGRRIEARIPRGVQTGSRVRLAGQGEAGIAGGSAGDLFLRVQVMRHPVFERDGDDLKTDVQVELYTCILGGEVSIQTLDRPMRLTIPPESANGKVFRLRGLGMPTLKDASQRGDLYVTIRVQLPQNLSQRELELFRQLREARR